MRYVCDVMYHVVRNKDKWMSIVLSIVYMFTELKAMYVDHTDEEAMTTDLMIFDVQSSEDVDAGQVLPIFNHGHCFGTSEGAHEHLWPQHHLQIEHSH